MNSPGKRIPPWLSAALSLIAQIIGFAVGVAARDYPVVAVMAHGLTAAFLAKYLGTSLPWQIVNFFLPVCLLVARNEHSSEVQTVVGAMLLFMAAIYLPTLWTHVPFFPTGNAMQNAILGQLPKDQPFTFVDLGSGFGSMLLSIARERPLGTFLGVEVSLVPLLWSKARSTARRNVTFQAKSLWKVPLAEFDFVYAFLSPVVMPRLLQKASQELGEGQTLLVNSFGSAEDATEVVNVGDGPESALYLYRY